MVHDSALEVLLWEQADPHLDLSSSPLALVAAPPPMDPREFFLLPAGPPGGSSRAMEFFLRCEAPPREGRAFKFLQHSSVSSSKQCVTIDAQLTRLLPAPLCTDSKPHSPERSGMDSLNKADRAKHKFQPAAGMGRK